MPREGDSLTNAFPPKTRSAEIPPTPFSMCTRYQRPSHAPKKQIPIPIYAPEVDDAELPTFLSLVKSTGPSSPVVIIFLGLLGSRPKVPGFKSRFPSLSRFTLVAESRRLAAALAARLTCMSYAASASTRLLSSSSFSSSSS